MHRQRPHDNHSGAQRPVEAAGLGGSGLMATMPALKLAILADD